MLWTEPRTVMYPKTDPSPGVRYARKDPDLISKPGTDASRVQCFVVVDEIDREIRLGRSEISVAKLIPEAESACLDFHLQSRPFPHQDETFLKFVSASPLLASFESCSQVSALDMCQAVVIGSLKTPWPPACPCPCCACRIGLRLDVRMQEWHLTLFLPMPISLFPY